MVAINIFLINIIPPVFSWSKLILMDEIMNEILVRYMWRALVNTVMNLWGPIKCWEFLELLRDWWLFKDSAPWS
jgi:hypothetical protein